jgi:hypothetical protein
VIQGESPVALGKEVNMGAGPPPPQFGEGEGAPTEASLILDEPGAGLPPEGGGDVGWIGDQGGFPPVIQILEDGLDLRPMEPGGNWPSARWRRASEAVSRSSQRWVGFP